MESGEHEEKKDFEDSTYKGDMESVQPQGSSSKVRKSQRQNMGQMPERFGEWDYGRTKTTTNSAGDDKSEPEDNNDENLEKKVMHDVPVKTSTSQMMHRVSTRYSVKSYGSNRSNASMLKNKAIAELEAEMEMAKLQEQHETKKMQRMQNISKKKLALRIAEIDEEFYQESEADFADCDDSKEDGRSSPRRDYEAWLHELPQHSKYTSTPANTKAIKPPVDYKPSFQDKVHSSHARGQNANPGYQATAMNESTGLETFVVRQAIGKELPQFSGDPTEWLSFKTQYEEMTKLCKFSEAENWCRLQKSLRGRAKDSVQALLSVPGNVTKIISILERRYGRPDLIIETLLDKARKTPVGREDRPESIIELSDVIENMSSTIQILGRKSYLNNPFILKELLAKLPPSMRLNWGEHVVSSGIVEPSLMDLSGWISRVADYASVVRSQKILDPKSSVGVNFKHGMMKETVLTASENEQKAKYFPSKKCSFCDRTNHSLHQCWKFKKKEIGKRWDFVRKENLCYSCLERSHLSRLCKQRKECKFQGCSRWHHELLHKAEDVITPETKQNHSEMAANIVHENEKNNKALLSVLPVMIEGPNGCIKTHALLDWGSTITLIDVTLADELGLQGTRETFSMKTLYPLVNEEKESRRVSFKISGIGTENAYKIKKARTVAELRLPLHTVDEKDLVKWDHLKNLPILPIKGVRPLLLIGQDNCALLAAKEASRYDSTGPVATRTALGWVLHGRSCHLKSNCEEVTLHAGDDSDENLHHMMKNFFKTESMGVKITSGNARSKEDKRAQIIMDATTRKLENRWETGLLWRNDNVSLPESKIAATKRLYGIERRMDRDPEFAEKYVNKINDYITKGYVRKLTTKEAAIENPRTWYLPHFGVVNANKPAKFRLVFDAASISHGTSLNDALVTGPDLYNSLVGVLSKFRQHKIGFTADIAEMFHQVKIRDQDLCAQRFLWRGADRNRNPDIMQMNVMFFGAACSPCSAQEVKNRNAREFEDEFPDAAGAIINKHYMDDYLDSKDTQEEAIKIIREVIEIHKKGGFTICNWICSDKYVESYIPDNMRANVKVEVSLDTKLKTERILGLHWSPQEDTFTFKYMPQKIPAALLQRERSPSKREVLKVVMALYDPLGFLSFFTIKSKILLQEIWRTEIGWDDELTRELTEKWDNWLCELRNIEQVKIPRCFTGHEVMKTSRQLHCYCDASEKAFCAAVYMRSETEAGIVISLVASKARVAPLKPISIPRLELQAALLGSRLVHTIEEELELKFGTTIFWSDSRTVLCWLKSDARRYKQFVSHRVGEICELTDSRNWRWVPTKSNPADLATRDQQPCDFSNDNWWWSGPAYLLESELSWPVETTVNVQELIPHLECKEEFTGTTFSSEQWILNFSRFSKLQRLIRTMAWVLRFFQNSKKFGMKRSGELQHDELRIAEVVLIRKCQQESFPKEWSELSAGKNVSEDSSIYTLSPTMDKEGLIRVKGRINNAGVINEDTNYPKIIHRKHMFTILVLQHYHECAGHNGQEKVVNDVRQKYWVPNLRTAVRSTWSSCQLCKNKRLKPVITEMGLLPECRLEAGFPPFTHTGLDYFGPLEVTIGRRREKRYGALFTCMVTRAIHLEIAHSLSTDSAIMAIRRMMARRGAPSHIYCDNGTNFRGAEREIRESIQSMSESKIREVLSSKGVQWHFNPPASPHMGGSWERMVRSVKTALYATLKERAPKEETLSTLMAEVENIVNSRPLTHVSVDINDMEALTPNHFLQGGNRLSVMSEYEEKCVNLRKQWKFAQNLSDLFWRRWTHEYLPTLARRTKWHRSEGEVKVGSVVVLADGNLPRNTWPLGIIEELFPGKDGKTRVVTVRTSGGVYKRPMAKICPLDVKAEVGVNQKNSTPGGSMLLDKSQDEV